MLINISSLISKINRESVDRAVMKKVEEWTKATENAPKVKAVMKEHKANQSSKWDDTSASTYSSTSSSTSSYSFKYFALEEEATSSSSPPPSSSSAPSDLFADLVVSFSEHFAFKRKSELTEQIKKLGGTVSYMLSDRCSHLIATEKEVKDGLSSKVRTALRFVEEGRPFHVISGEWVDECLKQGAKVKEYPSFDLLAQLRLVQVTLNVLFLLN
jgi:NAD-dependent DNA ligase